jgi:hypothetical protein
MPVENHAKRETQIQSHRIKHIEVIHRVNGENCHKLKSDEFCIYSIIIFHISSLNNTADKWRMVNVWQAICWECKG